MRTINLNHDTVDSFVAEYKKNNTIFWNGWDLVIHRPDARAMYSSDGRFHEGKWGYQQVTSPDSTGVWRVNARDLRFTKTSTQR